MEDSPASSSSPQNTMRLNDVIDEIVRFSNKNGGIAKSVLLRKLISEGIDHPLESIVAVLESIGAKVVDERVDAEEREERERKSGPAPWNSVGMYLHNSSGSKLMTRDEERAWFQVIDASCERMFDLFSRYPFAAEMYIRELEHLASGRQHFDSIVSESSGMTCAEYKRAIPGYCKAIAEAIDTLVGASTLRREMMDGADAKEGAEGLLDAAREEIGRRLKELSFRQSVVEDLCDVAYEDIYLPYLERVGRGGADDEDSVMGMFGMTSEEFVESFKEVRQVLDIIHAARSRIAESNLRLVVHVAKKYTNRGVELSDILQDGSIGLMNAIRKFDMSRGHKFSTFATWWIRQAISRSLTNNSRTIRIPSHKIDQLNKLDRTERELSQSLHRPPTDAEASAAMGVSAEDVRQLRDIRQQTVSLDKSIGEEGDSALLDVVGDERAANPAAETERRLLCDKVRDALSCLSDREKMVVDMRFGLSDGTVRTLEEIGRIFNVTREHIRQVELEALAKLRGADSLVALAELVK